MNRKKLIFLKWSVSIVSILLISITVWGGNSIEAECENVEALEEGDELIYCTAAGGLCFVGDMGYGGISIPAED